MPIRNHSNLHPLVTGAAVSLIVLSIVGVGVLTGLIPSPLAQPAPQAVAAADSAPGGSSWSNRWNPSSAYPASQANRDDRDPYGPAGDAGYRDTAPPPPARRASLAPASCATCGVVESVRSYKVKGQGTGLGAVGGGVVGGLVGNQFGGGGGRTALTVLGALGGAYAGNQVERNVRSTTRYEMTVRMDDGRVRTFQSSTPYNWASGDPVRVENGHVTSRSVSSSAAPEAVRVAG